jgi:hypothetical protein
MRKLLVLLLAAFLGAMLLVSSSAARGPDNWDYRDPGTAPGGEDVGWGQTMAVQEGQRSEAGDVFSFWLPLFIDELSLPTITEITSEEVQEEPKDQR